MSDEVHPKAAMGHMADEMKKLRDKQNRARRRRASLTDYSFKYNKGNLPSQKRSSARLAHKKYDYTYPRMDLSDPQEGTSRQTRRTRYSYYDNNDSSDEDLPVFRPKKRNGGVRRSEVPFVAADKVTEEYIRNIASRFGTKQHSADGTSCHQCRQKTKDSKTYCRSGNCIGMRGQFCGICLSKRYGEDAATALRDPEWACPPCRNLCNCSICRSRIGKRPTGVMAPAAVDQGFRSVADFLDHLQEHEQARARARNALIENRPVIAEQIDHANIVM